MEEKKYFSFEADHQYFAVPIEAVNRIIGIQDINTIPKQPDYLKGVINLRGLIVPIVDFRLRMGLAETEYNDRTTIIITELNNMFIGYIVDDVNEVLTIPEDKVSILSESKKEMKENELIWGYYKTDKKIIKLLDFDNLIEK
jgi:purine-binding chemotaxis protein CheW